MGAEKTSAYGEKQKAAYVFASHMQYAKSDREAAKLFARSPHAERSRWQAKKLAIAFLKNENRDESPLSEEEKNVITEIRQKLEESDQERLEEKKGNFSGLDRSILVFKAKSKFLGKQSNEERLQMYKKAGYTGDEITKVTDGKVVFSAVIGTALNLPYEPLRAAAAVMDDSIPLVDQLPNTWEVAGLSLGAYAASLGLLVEKNLQLTKKVGASIVPTLTTLYYFGDKLLSNKGRDWLARGSSLGVDMTIHAGIIGGSAAFASGDVRKIAAASIISAAYNGVLFMGSDLWLRLAGKREKGMLK